MNESRTLRLDQFLKLSGITDTGGQAKLLIQDGEVKVNAEVETRRRRKLQPGDVIEIEGDILLADELFAEMESYFAAGETERDDLPDQ